MGFKEREGRYPFQKSAAATEGSVNSDDSAGVIGKKGADGATTAQVREIEE